jgi:hypothetical protein
MKKSLFITSIFLAIPLVSYASINTNLGYGSTGTQVVGLQQFLISNGYLQGTATGNFYSLTQQAVENFQSANGISPTGYVGSLTRAAINAKLNGQNNSSQNTVSSAPSTVTTACPQGYSCVPVNSTQQIHGQAPTISYLNNGVISGNGFTGATSVYIYNPSIATPIELPFTVVNDTTIDVSSPANGMTAGEYNLYVVNPQGTSAPFSIDIPTPQTQTQTSAQSPVSCPSGETLESGAGWSECAAVQGQQSVTPTVSAACQQAEQDVQTAYNTLTNFNQTNPLLQASQADLGASALISSGRGQILGNQLAGEQQGLADTYNAALEEEQIACQ